MQLVRLLEHSKYFENKKETVRTERKEETNTASGAFVVVAEKLFGLIHPRIA